jgi:predicted RNA binding protein YcfA (HicA-like mRNA interferase family)
MPTIETNTRKIIARLEREGWKNIGGGSHDRFIHAAQPGVMVTVPGIGS